MQSVPGAVATGSQLVHDPRIRDHETRSLPLPVLTSSSELLTIDLGV
ncbi:MAG: hypothetical protein QOI77_1108 [Blastocatellia bacterium]|nr:hypothetical protein [Blastocatellia bacterium]